MYTPPALNDDLPSRPSASARVLRDPAIVAALAIAAFGLSLRGGFVWDDLAFHPLSPRLDGPLAGFRHGLWWFTSVGDEGAVYRPLVVLLTWAVAPLAGEVPARWHLVNVALHGVASVLVYALARRPPFSATAFGALCGAALFAVHPVHVEAVAYHASFGHVLATCFALLAALAQLRHARTGRGLALAAAVASAAAAILSSEGALVVPPLLLALEASARRRWPSLGSVVAHVAALALVLAMRASVLGPSLPVGGTAADPLRSASFAAAYARNLVAPWPQRILAALPPGGVAGVADWLLAAAAVTAAAWLLVRTRREERSAPAVAIAWIVAPLAPLAVAALNAKPFFAPRALYLPSAGLSVLAAWLLRDVAPSRIRLAGLAAAATLGVVACNVASAPWRDDLRVHLRMLEATPGASRLHAHVAGLYEAAGERAAAARHWEEALRTAADREQRLAALGALAVLHGTGGRPDEAERLLRLALAEDPRQASVWVNLGNVALSRGDLSAAAASYARALELDPGNREAAHNAALIEGARR